MARLTAAQKREAAAKAAGPKLDDVVTVTITGYIIDDGPGTYGINYDNGEEFYWGIGDPGVTYVITESADIYDEGTVIKDAEGCVFVRAYGNGYYDSDKLTWRGLGDTCDTPTRPFTVAEFK